MVGFPKAEDGFDEAEGIPNALTGFEEKADWVGAEVLLPNTEVLLVFVVFVEPNGEEVDALPNADGWEG